MGSNDGNVTRRQFLASSALIAGYALAAKPVFAAAVRTDESGLATGTASIPVDGGEMEAYFAAPESAVSPPVALVVHEIFGVHEYIRDVCRRLAKAGYFAIAPDLYRRQGDVSKRGDVDAIVREVVSKVPDAQVLADLDATLAWLKSEDRGDPSRVVITGFSWVLKASRMASSATQLFHMVMPNKVVSRHMPLQALTCRGEVGREAGKLCKSTRGQNSTSIW